MAKSIKDKWLGARVDAKMEAKVVDYIKIMDEIDGMGDFIRKAVNEFIANHPPR